MKLFDEIINVLSESLGKVDESTFEKLVGDCEFALKSGHKIIASGLGKNVPICEKFEGTMISLGLDAEFLHTNSAIHGDIGMVKSGDVVILLTKSGSTQESVILSQLLLARENVTLWLLTCNPDGKICSIAHNSLIVPLSHEGDLWDIMPNNSSTLFLIVLQKIAMSLAVRLDIKLEDFKKNHPGGAIGEKLSRV